MWNMPINLGKSEWGHIITIKNVKYLGILKFRQKKHNLHIKKWKNENLICKKVKKVKKVKIS